MICMRSEGFSVLKNGLWFFGLRHHILCLKNLTASILVHGVTNPMITYLHMVHRTHLDSARGIAGHFLEA
jgi:hypothetical protein